MKKVICCFTVVMMCLGLSLNCAGAEKMGYRPMPEPPPPAEIGSPPGAIVLKAMTFLPLRHTSNSGFYWSINTINKQSNGELVIKFMKGGARGCCLCPDPKYALGSTEEWFLCPHG